MDGEGTTRAEDDEVGGRGRGNDGMDEEDGVVGVGRGAAFARSLLQKGPKPERRQAAVEKELLS